MKSKKWIYFKNKGDVSKENYRSAEKLLKFKSLQRREINNNKIDINDIDINHNYIKKIEELGIKIISKSKWLNAIVVNIDDEIVNKLIHLDFILKIDNVRKLSTSAIDYQLENNLKNIILKSDEKSNKQNSQFNIDQLHTLGLKGEGVSILVIDTGFTLKHECLNHLTERIDFKKDFINKDDIVENQINDVSSQHNHGTYVLSVMAGKSQNYHGVCPESNFLLAKTENVVEEDIIEEYHFTEAVEWGESEGADIITASLGYIDWYEKSHLDGTQAVTTKIMNIAYEKGMICISSCGNEGKNGIVAPVDAFKVISVGAVNSYNNITYFSSRGPTYDNRIKPEVCALGSNTLCASPANYNYYTHISGTSLAAPIVAGLCSLLLQDLRKKYNTSNFENVRYNEIIRNALLYSSSNSKKPNNIYGWGIIDAMQAYNFQPLIINKGWSTLNLKFIPRSLNSNYIYNKINLDVDFEDIDIFKYDNGQYTKVNKINHEEVYYINKKSDKSRIINFPNDFCIPKESYKSINLNEGWNLVGGFTSSIKINEDKNINPNDLIYIQNNQKYELVSHDGFLFTNNIYWIRRNSL